LQPIATENLNHSSDLFFTTSYKALQGIFNAPITDVYIVANHRLLVVANF